MSIIQRQIMVFLIIAISIAALFALNQCRNARQTAVRHGVERNQAQAGMDSARDAVAATEFSVGKFRHIDATAEGNANEIRSAPGANAPVDPALARAARFGLCRYAANHRKPECLQQSDP